MSQEGIFLGDNVFLSFSDDGVVDAYILGDNRLSSDDDDLREMKTIHMSHGGIFLGINVFLWNPQCNGTTFQVLLVLSRLFSL